MSKKIMIPKIGANPYVVELNGVRYSYPAGTEQTVPDAVAAIIANDVALRPQEDPNAGADTPAAIKAALDALTNRVAALEEGGSGDIVRVPFTLTATAEGFSGTTDAVFSDVMAEKKKGKIILAAAKVNIYNEVTQYIDLILLTLDAYEESRFEGVAWMLSGSGTNLEAYDFKWTNDGVIVVQKKIAVP